MKASVRAPLAETLAALDDLAPRRVSRETPRAETALDGRPRASQTPARPTPPASAASAPEGAEPGFPGNEADR